MHLIGHTMGTPDRSVIEAAELFSEMGLDGMELMCRTDESFHTGIPEAEARRIAGRLRELGVPAVAITPYAWEINSPDPGVAEEAMAELVRAMNLAGWMRAGYVRAYSGKEDPGDSEGAFRRAVAALRRAAEVAQDRGVTLLVENHPGTVTRTGAATRRLIDCVGKPTVRALYDPANVLYDTDEDWETTLAVQLDVIGYVHVKDYDDRSGVRRACNVGEGVVPWREILQRLQSAGWDGCLSFEYEKRWYPDQLTDASDGMRRSVEFVRSTLEATSGH